MTTIKTNCPSCGAEVDLTPANVKLWVDNAESPGNNYFYGFICPNCFTNVEKPVDQYYAKKLQLAGVLFLGLLLRLPQDDMPSDPDAPPLGYDDILALHYLLATEGWFDDLLLLVNLQEQSGRACD